MPILLCALVALTACGDLKSRFSKPKTGFDGQAALGYVQQHLAFGPRTPGTPAHDSAANWEARFFEAGVPAGRVMSVPEILAHPHLESRGFIREFAADANTDRQRVTRAGFRLHDADTAPSTPAPVLSAHTREQLAALGYDDAHIDQLRAEGVV